MFYSSISNVYYNNSNHGTDVQIWILLSIIQPLSRMPILTLHLLVFVHLPQQSRPTPWAFVCRCGRSLDNNVNEL